MPSIFRLAIFDVDKIISENNFLRRPNILAKILIHVFSTL